MCIRDRIAIPLIVLPLVASGRSVRVRSRKAQDTLADASAFAAENLGAVRTMQAFGAEKTTNAPVSYTHLDVYKRQAGCLARVFALPVLTEGFLSIFLIAKVSNFYGIWRSSAARRFSTHTPFITAQRVFDLLHWF